MRTCLSRPRRAGMAWSGRSLCCPDFRPSFHIKYRSPSHVPPFQLNSPKPPKTSSPTPPPSTHICTILASTLLFIPPLLAFHTPSFPPSASISAPARPTSAAEAESRDGGSIVLTANRLRPVDGDEGAPTVTASTASATASSSREASKKTLSPTEMTRSVIGGRAGELCGGVLASG